MVGRTTPDARRVAADTAPDEVALRFNEPVEGAFGAVRVFDADSKRVDDGRTFRPGGDDKQIGVEA